MILYHNTRSSISHGAANFLRTSFGDCCGHTVTDGDKYKLREGYRHLKLICRPTQTASHPCQPRLSHQDALPQAAYIVACLTNAGISASAIFLVDIVYLNAPRSQAQGHMLPVSGSNCHCLPVWAAVRSEANGQIENLFVGR